VQRVVKVLREVVKTVQEAVKAVPQVVKAVQEDIRSAHVVMVELTSCRRMTSCLNQ